MDHQKAAPITAWETIVFAQMRLPLMFLLNSLLNLLRTGDIRMKVTQDTKNDLNWFINFLERFNERHSSLTLGHVQTPMSIHSSLGWGLSVLMALHTFSHLCSHKTVRFHVDNMAVVLALQKECIWDSFLQSVARSVWLLAVIHDITLEYTHTYHGH